MGAKIIFSTDINYNGPAGRFVTNTKIPATDLGQNTDERFIAFDTNIQRNVLFSNNLPIKPSRANQLISIEFSSTNNKTFKEINQLHEISMRVKDSDAPYAINGKLHGVIKPQTLGGKDCFVLLDIINKKLHVIKGDYQSAVALVTQMARKTLQYSNTELNTYSKELLSNKEINDISPVGVASHLVHQSFLIEDKRASHLASGKSFYSIEQAEIKRMEGFDDVHGNKPYVISSWTNPYKIYDISEEFKAKKKFGNIDSEIQRFEKMGLPHRELEQIAAQLQKLIKMDPHLRSQEKIRVLEKSESTPALIDLGIKPIIVQSDAGDRINKVRNFAIREHIFDKGQLAKLASIQIYGETDGLLEKKPKTLQFDNKRIVKPYTNDNYEHAMSLEIGKIDRNHQTIKAVLGREAFMDTDRDEGHTVMAKYGCMLLLPCEGNNSSPIHITKLYNKK